ncbi:MAG: ABC transporter ATP-binding protein [Candidatus Alcyoniella australis]|nr:ABC transporter ATP-binding protein [Candidatus Alcyoniella australis]
MGDLPAIEINDLSLSFDGRTLIDRLCMSVAGSEKVALVGSSGTGKSTLLRCIMGFIKPDSGSIRISGELVDEHSVWQLRRLVAFVAQEPDLGQGTVRQFFERMFAFRSNRSLKSNIERVPELFDRFGLERLLLDKALPLLSGGEKQRVALISAIVLDRRILLLDEASSALDEQSKQKIIDFLSGQKHMSVLSVSHDKQWLSFTSRSVELPDTRRMQ